MELASPLAPPLLLDRSVAPVLQLPPLSLPLLLLLAMRSAAAVDDDDDDDERTGASVALAPPVELELVFQFGAAVTPVDEVALWASPVLLLLLLLLLLLEEALKNAPVLEELLATAPALLLLLVAF